MTGRRLMRGLMARACLAALSTTAFHGAFAPMTPSRSGILHSLSGTMAISETTLKDHA
jgi:hypothetical protein